MKPTINVDEAARLAGVTRRSIYDWIFRGRILRAPDSPLMPGARVETESLTHYLDMRANPAPKPKPTPRFVRTERWCSRCKAMKPLEAYSGYGWCKACHRAYIKIWRAKRKQAAA